MNVNVYMCLECVHVSRRVSPKNTHVPVVMCNIVECMYVCVCVK